MQIAEYQSRIHSWIEQYGVRYFTEMTNTVLLVEEVGELARLMARLYGEQSFKTPTDEALAPQKIKDEMADILFVLGCLANQMNIDLEDAIEQNFKKKISRDKDRHKSNKKLG